MKVFLPAFFVFLLIVVGFICITKNQLNTYTPKIDQSFNLPARVDQGSEFQQSRGDNYAFQNKDKLARLNPIDEYINLSWDILSKVQYHDAYDQEKGHYSGKLTFGPLIKMVHDKEVIIEGHLIQIPDAGQAPFYILSAYPAAESFLSGKYGSETAMDLFFSKDVKGVLEEKKITVSGTFRVKDQDFSGLYYSLENVEIIEAY